MTQTIPIKFECQICKTMRPNDKIGVYTKPVIMGGKNVGEQYINYCNDNPGCIEAAKHYDHFPNLGDDNSFPPTPTPLTKKKHPFKMWIEKHILRWIRK